MTRLDKTKAHIVQKKAKKAKISKESYVASMAHQLRVPLSAKIKASILIKLIPKNKDQNRPKSPNRPKRPNRPNLTLAWPKAEGIRYMAYQF